MQSAASQFVEFLTVNAPVTVLTGAGISTASGIPDYRDRDGNWKNASPMQYQDFVNSAPARQRYWARSYSGWANISTAQPNVTHQVLASIERHKLLERLITQNVDCLHSRAGHQDVIDLHGRLDQVVCLSCRQGLERSDWQDLLADANPDWDASVDYYKPDGDAEIGADQVTRFSVPNCPRCSGTIKPDVVFFGENVPKDRVAKALDSVRNSSALVVVGSSLMVFSGFRFARLANELGKPILILNQGRTRADDLATVRIDADCSRVFEEVNDLL